MKEALHEKVILFLFIILFQYQPVFFPQSISLGNVVSNNSDSVSVQIKINNVATIGALTLYIKIDTTVLQWGRGIKSNTQIDDFVADINKNVIIFTCYSINGILIKDGILAELKFFYKGANTPTFLEFQSQNCELADINGIPQKIIFSNGSVQTRKQLLAILKSPADHSFDNDLSFFFKWKQTISSTEYCLQISTDSLFRTLIVNDSTLIDTAKYVENLQQNQKYFWRVRAMNNIDTSAWSEVWQFQTKKISIVNPPVLIIPANNSVIVFNFADKYESIQFGWAAVQSAERYYLEISSDLLFFNNVIETEITQTNTALLLSDFLKNTSYYFTQYYWRVTAKNSNGYSSCSQVQSFKVLLPAKLVSPLTNSQVSSSTVFKWKSVANSSLYKIIIYNDSTLSNMSMFTVNDTCFVLKDIYKMIKLGNGKKYFWRIWSVSINELTSQSDIWSFYWLDENESTPEQPNLFLPRNNSLNQPLTLTLNWTPVNGATCYRLQVSLDNSFMNLIVDDSTIVETSRQVTGLSSSSTYFWRVKAKNYIGAGEYSLIWNFQTAPKITDIPSLVYPSNDSFISAD